MLKSSIFSLVIIALMLVIIIIFIVLLTNIGAKNNYKLLS